MLRMRGLRKQEMRTPGSRGGGRGSNPCSGREKRGSRGPGQVPGDEAVPPPDGH